ncbi:hypothetical protein PanWU01x14_203010 [Parasponia andersonii]|uniref:Transmembrane protein n=1 Tax=Parasponia andersonii TaxID=3476 RepID=A0A2P5BWX0_PARAD|nr:hypothetical protein PanWU01x14_203010 [Parasponia andersonii]
MFSVPLYICMCIRTLRFGYFINISTYGFAKLFWIKLTIQGPSITKRKKKILIEIIAFLLSFRAHPFSFSPLSGDHSFESVVSMARQVVWLRIAVLFLLGSVLFFVSLFLHV